MSKLIPDPSRARLREVGNEQVDAMPKRSIYTGVLGVLCGLSAGVIFFTTSDHLNLPTWRRVGIGLGATAFGGTMGVLNGKMDK